ncbi:hypothetical protein J0S82_002402 [Galemys pyrenaicus]|uniref:Uncharacterized protein n=1 Tax=Galemys pyrenaicus TaxID=202257 RepID=A0A8J6AIU8_GALPY|nr:hypothetical protein J0S82_002402 [Galemys pyrenaicus]
MAMFEQMKANLGRLFKGIDRPSPTCSTLTSCCPSDQPGTPRKSGSSDRFCISETSWRPATSRSSGKPWMKNIDRWSLAEMLGDLKVWMSTYSWTANQPGCILMFPGHQAQEHDGEDHL